jgi:hypothetical protein
MEMNLGILFDTGRHAEVAVRTCQIGRLLSFDGSQLRVLEGFEMLPRRLVG